MSAGLYGHCAHPGGPWRGPVEIFGVEGKEFGCESKVGTLLEKERGKKFQYTLCTQLHRVSQNDFWIFKVIYDSFKTEKLF